MEMNLFLFVAGMAALGLVWFAFQQTKASGIVLVFGLTMTLIDLWLSPNLRNRLWGSASESSSTSSPVSEPSPDKVAPRETQASVPVEPSASPALQPKIKAEPPGFLTTLICSRQVPAFDLKNTTFQIGAFESGSRLGVEKVDASQGLVLVTFASPDGRKIRAWVRSEDVSYGPISPTRMMMAQFRQVENAFMIGNSSVLLEHTDPEVAKSPAAMDAAFAELRAALDRVRFEGVELIGVEHELVAEPRVLEGNLYGVMMARMVFTTPKKRIKVPMAVIGASFNQGALWYFYASRPRDDPTGKVKQMPSGLQVPKVDRQPIVENIY